MRKSTRDAIMAELQKGRDVAEVAERENRDLTAEERGKIEGFVSKANTMRTQAEEADAALKSLADLGDGVGILPRDDSERERPDHYRAPAKGKSVGQQFVESAEYKALLSSAPGGRFADQGHVQSSPVGMKSLITGLNDASAGSLIEPQLLGFQPGGPPFQLLQRPLTVRQLFSQGTTTSDSVEYVQMLAQTNNAAPVPEATSSAAVGDGTGGTATVVTGGVKPESGFTFTKMSTTVKTIAHWLPATKRALSDASQIRTLIDTFLRYGLEEEFEDQLVGGDGTGENFLGLRNVSGVQTQAAPVTASGEDNFTVTRRARRKVTIGGRTAPSAYVFHPIDWENIELMRDNNKQFYGAGPFALTSPSLWGLPVVESEAIAQGTAWCANWKMGIIWDREQATVQVTDSHADFFIRNLIAILAEMRAAFGILRPSAFCKITLG